MSCTGKSHSPLHIEFPCQTAQPKLATIMASTNARTAAFAISGSELTNEADRLAPGSVAHAAIQNSTSPADGPGQDPSSSADQCDHDSVVADGAVVSAHT